MDAGTVKTDKTPYPLRIGSSGDYVLLLAGIFLIAVNNEFAEQIFGHKVGYHGHRENNVFVDTRTLCQGTQPSGQGREDQVEAEYLRHGDGDVCGGLEGVAAVQGEIPQNRQHQCRQVSGPVGPVEQFVNEGERHDLDYSGGNGKEREFDRLQNIGLVHSMTSKYVDRYISEPNMINKYSRCAGGMQALIGFCTDCELFRQMIDIFFQETGDKVQCIQSIKIQPLKSMDSRTFRNRKAFASGKQICIGNVHQKIDAKFVISDIVVSVIECLV